MVPKHPSYLQQTGASASVVVGARRARSRSALQVDGVQVSRDQNDFTRFGGAPFLVGDDISADTTVDADVLELRGIAHARQLMTRLGGSAGIMGAGRESGRE